MAWGTKKLSPVIHSAAITGSSKEVDEEKKSPDDEARRVKLLKMILMRIQMGKK